MAKAKKIKEADQPRFPFALKRELEEIQKNSGMVIDYTLPIEELEKICNKANNPPDSWRDRWHEAGSSQESAKGEQK